MNLRRRAKQSLLAAIPSSWPAIIVASMGRSGSTLVFDAVRRGYAKMRFRSEAPVPLRLVTDAAWRPADAVFRRGVVYKTHAPADEMPSGFLGKSIFVFGRPSEAALSVLNCRETYGDEWIAQHFDHLGATGDIEDLPQCDVLGFEHQIRSWMSWSGGSRLMIRFDCLWDHQSTLESYLGFPIDLPPKRARRSAQLADVSNVESIKRAYRDLDAWVDNLPECDLRA